MVDYKQNSITNRNEMMNVIDSLPISILMMNSELKLLGVNRTAQVFLQIEDVDSCCGKEQMFIADHEYMRDVVKEVQLKTVVSNKRVMVRKFDKSISLVELFAHSYSGVNDVFLFMFFELNPSKVN
jgi:nitrogen-specific signal transduction histidine kinase